MTSYPNADGTGAEQAAGRLLLRLLSPSQRAGLFGLIGARLVLGVCDLGLAGAMYLLFLQLQGGAVQGTMAAHRWLPHSVLGTALATMVLVVLRMVLDIGCQRAVAGYTQSIYARFMVRLANGYGAMRWGRLVQRNRSELLKHMTVTALDAGFSYQLAIELVSGALLVVLFAVALVYENPRMAAVLAAAGAVLYGVHHLLLRGRLNRAAAQRESALRALQRLLAELLASGKEVRTYGNQAFFEEKIGQQAERVGASNVRLAVLPHIARVLADQGVVVLFLGIVVEVQLRHGDMRQLLALLVYYFVLSRRLVPLISQLAMVLGQTAGAMENIRSIGQELDECAAYRAEASPSLPPPEGLVLQLEGVRFCFDTDASEQPTEVLRGVDLRMRRGEIVALYGVSGSGKSSLLNVIAGVAQASHGVVRVDRASVAYVPQEIVLLDDSVRNNLLFGLASVPDEELMQVLRLVRLDGFVAALPQGLDTRAGDNGVLFSGGERQRLGLARAMLRRVGLLLLDEATSAVDEENERHILNNLAASGVGLLLVTHRQQTRQIAGRVLYLEGGRLAGPANEETGLVSSASSWA